MINVQIELFLFLFWSLWSDVISNIDQNRYQIGGPKGGDGGKKGSCSLILQFIESIYWINLKCFNKWNINFNFCLFVYKEKKNSKLTLSIMGNLRQIEMAWTLRYAEVEVIFSTSQIPDVSSHSWWSCDSEAAVCISRGDVQGEAVSGSVGSVAVNSVQRSVHVQFLSRPCLVRKAHHME